MTPCKLWAGKTNGTGYGRLGSRLVHRLAYELEHGEIPEDLTVDHLCCNRLCYEVTHLEAVTRAENTRRMFARRRAYRYAGDCKYGHSMEDAYVHPKTGHRQCRTCRREAMKAFAAKNPDYNRDRKRAAYPRDREKLRERNRENRQRDPEQWRAKQREYGAAFRARRKAQGV